MLEAAIFLFGCFTTVLVALFVYISYRELARVGVEADQFGEGGRDLYGPSAEARTGRDTEPA